MRARAAHVQGSVVEIEIAGGYEELQDIATVLRAGRGMIACGAAGDPSPYAAFFTSIEVVADESDRVRIAADGTTVRILGAAEPLAGLSDVFDDLADEALGDHVHVEWYPEHPMIAKGSIPTVLALLDD